MAAEPGRRSPDQVDDRRVDAGAHALQHHSVTRLERVLHAGQGDGNCRRTDVAEHRETAGHTITIDTKGVDMQAYEMDLEECNAYADQVDLGEKALTRGVTGGIVAGTIGAIFGGSRGAERGAGAGAVLGTADGVQEGIRDREQVVRRCLSGRGYRVLS